MKMGCPKMEYLDRLLDDWSNALPGMREEPYEPAPADHIQVPAHNTDPFGPTEALPYKVVLDIMHFRDGSRAAAIVYATVRPRPKMYARVVEPWRGYGVAVRAPEDQQDGQDLRGEEIALERAIQYASPEVQSAVRSAWNTPEHIPNLDETRPGKLRLPRWRRISRPVDVLVSKERLRELIEMKEEAEAQSALEAELRRQLDEEHRRVVNVHRVVENQREQIDRLNARIARLVNMTAIPSQPTDRGSAIGDQNF